MTIDIVSGLFGLTPWKARQERIDQMNTAAANYAAQSPFERSSNLLYRGGYGLGEAVAPAVGLADPRVEELRQQQAIMSQVDTSSAEGLLQGAILAKDTNPRLAAMLIQAAQVRKAEESKLALEAAHAKYYSTAGRTRTQSANAQLAAKQAVARNDAMKFALNAGYSGQELLDFVDEQVQRVTETWNATMGTESPMQANPVQSGGTYESGIKLSPTTAIDHGLRVTQKDKDAMIADATARGDMVAVEKIKELPVSTVKQLPKSKAEVAGEIKRAQTIAENEPKALARGAAAKEGGKAGIEINTKLYNTASAARKVVDKTETLINHLKTGNITTGMAADLRVGLARMISLLGGKDAAKNATDSQIADVMMGSEVFPLISSLGIGARGMDTPAEREFMRKVLTGTLPLEKGTLLRMAEIRRDAAQRDIDIWDEKVDAGDLDNYFSDTGIPKTKFGGPKISAPKMPPPTDADINATALKYKITPAEVRRRLGL